MDKILDMIPITTLIYLVSAKNIFLWMSLFLIIGPFIHICRIYKTKSKIDFIFIMLLVFFLIFPALYVNEQEVSNAENRKLAAKPSVLIIKMYGKEKKNIIIINKAFDKKYHDMKAVLTRSIFRLNAKLYYRLKYHERIVSKKIRRTKFSRTLRRIKSIKINYQFGLDYEKWFNDRFYGRDILISLYNNICYKISLYVYKAPQAFFIKKTKFFLWSKGDYYINKSDAKIMTDNLKIFKNYLDNKYIKFYMITVPQKGYLLQNQNIKYKNYKQDDCLDIFDFNEPDSVSLPVLSQILNNKYNINSMEMLKVLNDGNKHDLVYYKTDHHLTDYGFYLVYEQFMKMVKKDFPDIKVNTVEDFDISKNKLVRYDDDRKYRLGVTHKISGIRDDKIFDVLYTYFDYKKLKDVNIKIINTESQRHTNPNGKYKVLLIGDSFTKGFVYFLNTSFYDVRLYRVNNKKYPFETEPIYKWIDEFNPDIVIFFTSTNRISDYKFMYPQKNK